MNADLHRVWVYLAQEPLLGLTVTLVAYQIGLWIHVRMGRPPLVNPVLVAVVALVGVLAVTDTDYRTYFEGAQFVHFLLGPATVALAVPLYRQFAQVRRSAVALIAALVVGSLTAGLSAIIAGRLVGMGPELLMTLAPKSATTPIAMGISEQLGGLPSLTAVLVLLTGMVGAVCGTWLLARLRVTDPHAVGLALGTASHGFGTARSLQLGEAAGAFSGLAMGLNGLATAILLPGLVALARIVGLL